MKSLSYSSRFVAPIRASLGNDGCCGDLRPLTVQSGHRDTGPSTTVANHRSQGPYSGTIGPKQAPEGDKMASQSGDIAVQRCNFHSV